MEIKKKKKNWKNKDYEKRTSNHTEPFEGEKKNLSDKIVCSKWLH